MRSQSAVFAGLRVISFMRITQVTTRFWPYPAGLEVSLDLLCRELATDNHEVTVLTTNSNGESSIPQIRLYSVPFKRGLDSYPVGLEEITRNYHVYRRRAWLRLGPFHLILNCTVPSKMDILHIHSLFDPFSYLPMLSTNNRKRSIGTIHDVDPSVATPLESRFWASYSRFSANKLFDKFSALIVPSNNQLDFLKRIGANESRIFKIPLCFDKVGVEKASLQNHVNIRSKYGVNADDFLIVSIGRLIPVKRYDLLLKAISSIKECYSSQNLKCLIVGGDEGILPSLEKIRTQLSLQDIVQFVGALDHSEALKVLSSADLFVMPSSAEAFNVSTIEAMALAVPVLVSDGVGASYLVEHCQNGLIFQKNNLEKLVYALSIALTKKGKLKRLGQQGYITAYKTCSPTAVAAKHIDVYRKIINA